MLGGGQRQEKREKGWVGSLIAKCQEIFYIWMNDKCLIVTRQSLKGKVIPFISLPNILSKS